MLKIHKHRYQAGRATSLAYLEFSNKYGSVERIVGPFSRTFDELPLDTLQSRDPDDFIRGTPRIFGENAVLHKTLSCDLTVNPLLDAEDPSHPGEYRFQWYHPRYGNWQDTVVSKKIAFNDPEDLVFANRYYEPGHNGVRYLEVYRRDYGSRFKVTAFDVGFIKFIRQGKFWTDVITQTTFNRFTPREDAWFPYDDPLWKEIWDYKSLLAYIYETVPSDNTYHTTEAEVQRQWRFPVMTQSSESTVLAPLLRKVRELSLDPGYLPDEPTIKSYGELAGEAAQAVEANQTNMIAFMKDLKDVKSLIPKLKNLKSLKTHAGNYLATKYGILPTVSDLDEIMSSFSHHVQEDKNGFQTFHAGHKSQSSEAGKATITSTNRVKIAIDDYDSRLRALRARLRSWGFYPSLVNIWDLVPYSFVLDWFIDLGSILESVDNKIRVAQLPVKYSTTSSRIIWDYSRIARDIGLDGYVERRYYRRETGPNSPRPPISFEAGITAQEHLLEGTALILQRK